MLVQNTHNLTDLSCSQNNETVHNLTQCDFFSRNNQTVSELTNQTSHRSTVSQNALNQMIAARILQSILPVLRLTPSCRVYHVTMSVGFSGTIIIFGLLGNLMSSVVLIRQKRTMLNASLNLLLVVLSVLDSLMLLIILLLKVIPSLCGLRICMGYLYFFSSYLMAYLLPMSATILAINEYIVVLIALQRYLFVCHNRLARKLCTLRMTCVQIFLTILSGTLYSLPRYFEFRLKYFPSIDRVIPRPTELQASKAYNLWYTIVSAYVIIYAIPLFLLSLVTYKLLAFLREAQKKRANLISVGSNTKKSEDETTMSLVAIVAVFCFTQIHNPIRRTLQLAIPKAQHSCPYFMFYYIEVVTLMNVVNYSVNFVLYCMFNRRFRAQVKALLSRKRAVMPTSVAESSVSANGSTTARTLINLTTARTLNLTTAA